MKQNLLQMVYNHILNTILGVKRFFLLYEYPNQLIRIGDKKLPRHELSTDTYPTKYLAQCKFDRTHDTAPNAFITSVSIHSFRMGCPAISWRPWFESILSRLRGRKYYFVLEEYGEPSCTKTLDTSTNIFFSFDEAKQYFKKREQTYVSFNRSKPVGIYTFRTRYPITEHSLWRDRQQGKTLSTTTY